MDKKVMLVTGASSGFGKETALQLIMMGHTVYGAARRLQLMEDIKEAGGYALYMDVTDQASVDEAINTIIKDQGRVDVLYANAGYGIFGSIFDTSVEDAMAMYDVNVHGTHRTILAVMPHMIRQKSGRIVITESSAAIVSTTFNGWYASTKHALKAMSTSLRAELKGLDIMVVTIRPGFVKTGFENVALAEGNTPEPTRGLEEEQKGFYLFAQDSYDKSTDMGPTVRCMVRAGTEDHPKKNYNTTMDARLFPFVQSIVGQRAFCAISSSMYKARYKKYQKTMK